MVQLLSQPSLLPEAWANISSEEDAGSISHGEVFTRPWVVDLILDLTHLTPECDLATMRVVEPACGSGAFLVPLATRISESCKQHGRSIIDAVEAVQAFDLNPTHVDTARLAVAQALEAQGWSQKTASNLAATWISVADFIVETDLAACADFVVGNPPYVRPEEISPARLSRYRRVCSTMGGRADPFIAFFEKGLRALKPNGTLGFICADRWMHNQYGQNLRSFVSEHFAMEAAIVMHDVDAFEEPVAAYPAITVIRRNEQRHVVVADTTASFGETEAKALLKWVKGRRSATKRTPTFEIAELKHWYTGKEGWPGGSPERLALVADLEERFPRIEDSEKLSRVRIGVATGADSLFITKDPTLVDEEQLVPLAMVEDLRTDEFKWSGYYLVDPWSKDDLPARLDRRGGLVDLNKYPKLRAYFESHKSELAGRKRELSSWYQTIDRVDHSMIDLPKLLFPDLKLTSRPVYEGGGHYPHHNLYYIVSSVWPLEVLGGILLSRFADLFINTYAVKMRGSTPRFQAQYLRRICVPAFGSIKARDREQLVKAFGDRDVERATSVACRLYGLRQSDAETIL